jgi:integrase
MFIEVRPNGSKYWRYAYRFSGKQKLISLGVYPEVSLAEARDNHLNARRKLRQGSDPSQARKAERGALVSSEQRVFGEIAQEWVERNESTWSASTLTQTRARLRNDVLPYIANRPLSELEPSEILDVAKRIVDRGALETARRVVRIIKQVLTHAVLIGEIKHNPAQDIGRALPSVRVKHMAAITDPAEVGALLRAIEGYEGGVVTRAALRMAPLVFIRPGELRHAEWADVDLEKGVWEIPADRTKMRTPLIIPLATQSLEIFRDLRPFSGSGNLVFPSVRSKFRPISENTLNAALRRLGYSKEQMTAHGFRAMARTLLDEQLEFRYDLIEHQLGHKVSDPNGRAYNRTRHLPERARMMQVWADYLNDLKSWASLS